jgi:hypothetical protein
MSQVLAQKDRQLVGGWGIRLLWRDADYFLGEEKWINTLFVIILFAYV